MSRTPSSPSFTSISSTRGPGLGLDVQIDASSVIATLGYFPAAAVRALHVRMIDLLSHHRRSVAKHHKFPAGRRAQRMLFARLSAKYATERHPTRIEQLVGTSFSRPAKTEPFSRDIMPTWNEPQQVNASESFVIPFGYGLATGGLTGNAGFTRGAKAAKVFREIFRAGGQHTGRELHFVRTSSGKVLAVLETVQGEKSVRRVKGVRTQKEGSSFQVIGVVARARRQPAMIDFFGEFDRIQAKHTAKMDRDMGMALTVAGRAKLTKSIEREIGLEGRVGTFRGELRREVRSSYFSNRAAIFDHISKAVGAASEREARRSMESKGGAA